MGYGGYSIDAHEALLRTRSEAPAQEVFKQRACHPLMNPKGVKLRECRDSPDHPSSVGVVFALDVTGSMGHIPKLLATQELPGLMKTLELCKVPDPQLLFCAVGDATSDGAPLQVGQFESTAELMDQWLTWCFLEGGGGGTDQESYELALYFLAVHTELDSVKKRGKRGYLFMTGDELPYPSLSRHIVESVVGDRLDDDLKTEEIVAELQKTLVPFFVIPDPDRLARCEDRWRGLLGDHVLCTEKPEDICHVSAGAIALCEGTLPHLDALAQVLRDGGVDPRRVNRVVRALTPFADARAGTSRAPPHAPPAPPHAPPHAPSLLERLFKK